MARQKFVNYVPRPKPRKRPGRHKKRLSKSEKKSYKKLMLSKMKGSPLLKDKKVWKWSGEQVTVDDSTLSPTEKKFDDVGNKTIKHNYTDKDGNPASDIMYLNKPRKESKIKEGTGPKMPHDKPIEEERFYT